VAKAVREIWEKIKSQENFEFSFKFKISIYIGLSVYLTFFYLSKPGNKSN